MEKHLKRLLMLFAGIAVFGIVYSNLPYYKTICFIHNIDACSDEITRETRISVSTYDNEVDDSEILSLYKFTKRRMTDTFKTKPEIFYSEDLMGYPRLNVFWVIKNGYGKLCIGQANDNNYLFLEINKKNFAQDRMFSEDRLYRKATDENIRKILDRSGMVNVFDYINQ